MGTDNYLMEIADNSDLVEIVDDNNRPIAILPKEIAHRQLLKHRSIQVLVFDPDKKLYLQKRNTNKLFFPGRWDVSARTHPRIGESTVDAALRVLKEELQLEVDHPNSSGLFQHVLKQDSSMSPCML